MRSRWKIPLRLWRRPPRVIVAAAAPGVLAEAVRLLDGFAYAVAPTTDVLDAELRRGPAVVVVDPSVQEGCIPRAALAPQLGRAVPFAALRETGGDRRKVRALLWGAEAAGPVGIAPGVLVLTARAGGVGVTTAALGLAQALATTGPTVLVEVAGPERRAALVERGPGQDGEALLLGELPEDPSPRSPGQPVVLGLAGPGLQAYLQERGIPALWAMVERLRRRARWVVLDVGPTLPAPPVGPGWRGLVMLDLRPEAVAGARDLQGQGYRPVLVARWGEGVGLPAWLRLDPPPDPGRWGRTLVRRLREEGHGATDTASALDRGASALGGADVAGGAAGLVGDRDGLPASAPPVEAGREPPHGR